ncbi:hypothetical protein [Tenacibaculum agarivorans]|uniref:hypothetical protein n=1 Tax=Tenacibaculum agarivorans TaxID=1908389 RepID=UPI00094BC230|nr:hypothetical protein [Tenacibaculum agarivorans]
MKKLTKLSDFKSTQLDGKSMNQLLGGRPVNDKNLSKNIIRDRVTPNGGIQFYREDYIVFD